MLVSLIAIGNSKGIRIPKNIIEQLQVEDTLELSIENNKIVLNPVKSLPRQTWAEAFKNMHENGEDKILDAPYLDSEAFDWEWK